MIKKFSLCYNITVIGYILSAIAILFVPISDITDNGKIGAFSIIVAIVFWLGLVWGTLSLIILTKLRHKLRARMPSLIVKIPKKFPGIMNFSMNIRHLILYAVILIGIVIIILDLILGFANQYLMFPVIAGTYSAFIMHCMIDGKNYQIYKILKKGEKK